MVKVIKETFNGVFREILQVTLTQEEYDRGVQAGVYRHTCALINKNRRSDGTKTTWDEDINGALGELVASIGLEKEWNNPGGVGQPDLVGGIEVRTVMSNDRRLKLKNTDKDNSPYVLVVGTSDHLVWKITGWIYGRDGKKTLFKDILPSIFLVDQQRLTPILQLKEE